MDGSDYPITPRDANGRFMPGCPGRRFGAVGKASARASRAILADFETHQDDLLPRLREWFVPQYVALVSRLLPRPEGEATSAAAPADAAALAAEIAALRAALAGAEAAAAAIASDAGGTVNNGD
jgi:hypothetical protein